MGRSSGVVWRNRRTFFGILAAVSVRNRLFLHNSGWMHVRHRPGNNVVLILLFVFLNIVILLPMIFQEKLYRIYKDKVDRPISHFDMSLTPKVGQMRRSQSMTSIRKVKPISTPPKFESSIIERQMLQIPTVAGSNGPYSRHRKLVRKKIAMKL